MSNSTPVSEILTVQRSIVGQQYSVDGAEIENARGGRYGEKYVLSPMPYKHLLSDEGSYFVATNPTIGTGVAYALQTSFSATAGFFAIQNTEKAGGKRLYLDMLKLYLTAAPTATVSMEFAFVLDTRDRAPTAGNVQVVPNCTNGDIPSAASIANLQAYSAATLTLPAAAGGTNKTVGRVRIPTSLGIIGDEYILQFGPTDIPGFVPGLTATRATAVARLGAGAPPIIVAPQQWLLIYMWWLTAATTAPSFEYELGWFER